MGRWFGTDIRVSVWFPLMGLVFVLQLGWQLGLAVTGLLLFSILFHEFAHVIAARRTGGNGSEILLWPLGGLAYVSPAPTFFSEGWTAMAGPISNAVLCLACLPAVLASGEIKDCLHPIYLPSGLDLAGNLPKSLLLLLFSLNFKLVLLNLLPIFPLDGGQFAYAWSKLYWDRQTARVGTLWFSLLGCMLILVGGAIAQVTFIVFMGAILFSFSLHEYLSAQISGQFDDSFMGYDFSQGYTSLEGEPEPEPRKPGLIERWKQERTARRREREELQRIETARRVDELLEKIHQQGKDSLTDEEKRFLNRASSKYRSQG